MHFGMNIVAVHKYEKYTFPSESKIDFFCGSKIVVVVGGNGKPRTRLARKKGPFFHKQEIHSKKQRAGGGTCTSFSSQSVLSIFGVD